MPPGSSDVTVVGILPTRSPQTAREVFVSLYLLRGLLLLSVDVGLPKTLSKFDHGTINNERHWSILLLVLVEKE